MNKLPSFDINDYRELLIDFIKDGRHFYPISSMGSMPDGKCIFLRHDVDLFLDGWLAMPQCENELGISATYYICLTQHYNIFHNENRSFLRQLIEMGHDIGLHYDVTTYPDDETKMSKHLEFEIGVLSAIVGKPIKTIVMHQPFKGNIDPFQSHEDYVNPNNPVYRNNLRYISDSCRAWRDEKLIECFGVNQPRLLMINLHPELWLEGRINNRIEYLENVLIKRSHISQKRYLDNTVRNIWLTHEAPKMHDLRAAQKEEPFSDQGR